MTYSSNLDPTVPGQAELAKLGAGRIRALTLAMKERLATIVDDVDADPLVLKVTAVAVSAMTMESVEYTFPAASTVPTLSSLFKSVTLSGRLATAPVVIGWRIPTGGIVYPLVVTGLYDGTELSVNLYNPTGANIDVTGKIIVFTLLKPPTV